MTLSSFISRFEERRETFVGKKSLITRVWYYIDWFFAFLIYGASINDYFAYEFYKLRHCGRSEFITYRKHKLIQQAFNNPKDIEICRDKSVFCKHFSAYLGREWIDFATATSEEILSFLGKHETVFVKEVLGFRGVGTKRYSSAELIDGRYKSLINKENEHYIAEEPIVQHHELREFHPWSVNTIRIVTVYDSKHDVVHLMNARIRMGNLRNNVDNLHFYGIGANINMESGVIESVGYDKDSKTYTHHPLTGKQIIGFTIPYWSECKIFIEKAARQIPNVGYIGWDLVILEDGKMCLIEANDNADHDLQQLYNRPLWGDYKRIIKQL